MATRMGIPAMISLGGATRDDEASLMRDGADDERDWIEAMLQEIGNSFKLDPRTGSVLDQENQEQGEGIEGEEVGGREGKS